MPPPLTASIPFERRPSEPGRSRFRLQLPGPRLPIARLELDVDGDHVMRQATISEPRFDGRQVQPSVIGTATLKRVSQRRTARRSARGSHRRADRVGARAGRGRREQSAAGAPLGHRRLRAAAGDLFRVRWQRADRAVRRPEAASRPRYDLEAARESLRVGSGGPGGVGCPSARRAHRSGGRAAADAIDRHDAGRDRVFVLEGPRAGRSGTGGGEPRCRGPRQQRGRVERLPRSPRARQCRTSDSLRRRASRRAARAAARAAATRRAAGRRLGELVRRSRGIASSCPTRTCRSRGSRCRRRRGSFSAP